MKKVLYRDILGSNPRKHEVSVEEIIGRRSGWVSKKKICKFFVKETFLSEDVEELREWIRVNQKKATKNCHIMRKADTSTGENKVVCKVLGDFFVVWGKTAYRIVYVNEIRIELADSTVKREVDNG
jgi:hypothetical protein